MTELKEAIKPALPGKNKKHDEAELKILEIRDADGASMIGREFDPRLFAEKDGKKCKIKTSSRSSRRLSRSRSSRHLETRWRRSITAIRPRGPTWIP